MPDASTHLSPIDKPIIGSQNILVCLKMTKTVENKEALNIDFPIKLSENIYLRPCLYWNVNIPISGHNACEIEATNAPGYPLPVI